MYGVLSHRNNLAVGLAGTFARSALITPLALPVLSAVLFAALASTWAGTPFTDFLLAYLSECPLALSDTASALWVASFFAMSLASSARCQMPSLTMQGYLPDRVMPRLKCAAGVWAPVNGTCRGGSTPLLG